MYLGEKRCRGVAGWSRGRGAAIGMYRMREEERKYFHNPRIVSFQRLPVKGEVNGRLKQRNSVDVLKQYLLNSRFYQKSRDIGRKSIHTCLQGIYLLGENMSR